MTAVGAVGAGGERELRVRALAPRDAGWAGAAVREAFASERVVSRGVLHDTRALPGVVAECGERPVGVLHYDARGAELEVVTVIALERRTGVGRALLAEAEARARALGCQRLWLVTTNDNATAQAFYAALGWTRVAIHRGALREARHLKPELPERAADGTPLEDELEFERRLGAGA